MSESFISTCMCNVYAVKQLKYLCDIELILLKKTSLSATCVSHRYHFLSESIICLVSMSTSTSTSALKTSHAKQ